MGIKLKIQKGATFNKPLRWECEPFIYKPIQLIQNSAPCALNVTGHGLLADQLFVVQAAQGLTELNAAEPHISSNWYRATVLDADHIQINRSNSLLFKKHTEGTGVIKYRTVVDLTGYTARMMIRTKLGGDVLLTLTTENGMLVIDPVLQYVRIVLDAATTAAIEWLKGTFDLELVSPSGNVIRFIEGEVQVSKENTTV